MAQDKVSRNLVICKFRIARLVNTSRLISAIVRGLFANPVAKLDLTLPTIRQPSGCVSKIRQEETKLWKVAVAQTVAGMLQNGQEWFDRSRMHLHPQLLKTGMFDGSSCFAQQSGENFRCRVEETLESTPFTVTGK
ncbi:hypothetical protein FQA39_LY03612 [Lamprigera yunnana]|nr:hypothetical protein FQA39_LY03612 [Lamprigera yunnana]